MKTFVRLAERARARPSRAAFIVFSAFTTRASGKRPLDLLAEAVVVADRQRRRHAVTEVERVARCRSGPCPARFSAPGRLERLERRSPGGRVDDHLAEAGRIRERPLARPLARLGSPGDRLLVARPPASPSSPRARAPRACRDRPPDHPRSQHPESHRPAPYPRTISPPFRHTPAHIPSHPRRHHFRDARSLPELRASTPSAGEAWSSLRGPSLRTDKPAMSAQSGGPCAP